MEVKITITERCNAQCTSCLTPSIKNPRDMSFETFKEIIDEIISVDFIQRVHLYSVGESLLHPQLQEMIDYAVPRLKDRGIISIITTNGSIDLTKYNLTGINVVVVSFNAFSKEVYDEHIKLNWFSVLDNIKKIGKVRPIEMHILNYNNETEIAPEILELKSIPNISIRIGNKVDNQVGEFYEADNTERIPCDYVNDMFIFNSNGDTILCSHDFHSKKIYGNIKDYTISELLELKQEDIKKHKKLEFTGLCEKCNYNKKITSDMFRWL